MPLGIGFDIYGTLVDPLEMNGHLRPMVGDLADRFAEIWREKQVEYAFRRGLTGRYEDFGVCTRQALRYAMRALKTDLREEDQERLLSEYQRLEAFPDVVTGLETLQSQGHQLAAFSNGSEAAVRSLLDHAAVLPLLDQVVSVDNLRTFKPDPRVYAYLGERLGRPVGETWLVSSNPWDVIGAKSAGLRAAWVRRKPDAVYDPWGVEPDLVAANLSDLAVQLTSSVEGEFLPYTPQSPA